MADKKKGKEIVSTNTSSIIDTIGEQSTPLNTRNTIGEQSTPLNTSLTVDKEIQVDTLEIYKRDRMILHRHKENICDFVDKIQYLFEEIDSYQHLHSQENKLLSKNHQVNIDSLNKKIEREGIENNNSHLKQLVNLIDEKNKFTLLRHKQDIEMNCDVKDLNARYKSNNSNDDELDYKTLAKLLLLQMNSIDNKNSVVEKTLAKKTSPPPPPPPPPLPVKNSPPIPEENTVESSASSASNASNANKRSANKSSANNASASSASSASNAPKNSSLMEKKGEKNGKNGNESRNMGNSISNSRGSGGFSDVLKALDLKFKSKRQSEEEESDE